MTFSKSPSYILTAEQAAMLTLWQLCNMSVTAVQKLLQIFATAQSCLVATPTAWRQAGIHTSHIKRLTQHQQQYAHQPNSQLTERVQTSIQKGAYQLLFADSVSYPTQLNHLIDAPPILFTKGDTTILTQAQLAIVGTRKPSTHAKKITEDFAQVLANEGVWITSGLADGIDKHAHIGALKQGNGRTVAVLGTGINLCYPKQNQGLLDAIVDQGGCVITEFLPDIPPNAHNFPRRNRLVSGLSLGVLVVEAALKSGSLITARLAAEQGKLVFAMPGHIYNTQAKGCHHLIREGAILVDEPAQIIEDINLPKSWHMQAMRNNPSATSQPTNQPVVVVSDKENVLTHQLNYNGDPSSTNNGVKNHPHSPQAYMDNDEMNNHHENRQSNSLPVNLHQLLLQLDWIGQDMDELVTTTQKEVATLTSELMQLELLGLVVQQGGRYLRCRPT